jgi:hypothetical protein
MACPPRRVSLAGVHALEKESDGGTLAEDVSSERKRKNPQSFGQTGLWKEITCEKCNVACPTRKRVIKCEFERSGNYTREV